MTATTWHQQATIEPTGEDRYTAHVGPAWNSLKGAHGGIVASLALDAVEASLRDRGVGTDTVLRAATFGYVSGNVPGESTIEVDIVRQGRSMVNSQVVVTQDGRITTVARFHHSAPRRGPEWSDVVPLGPKPDDAERYEAGEGSHLANVETWFRPGGALFAGSDRAEWMAWCRPLEGPAFGTSWLAMFGDYFPPPIFATIDAPTPAVTIEYSLQIHDDAGSWTLGPGEYLAAYVHTFHSHDGFAVEDGRIQMPDGSLLATFRQTRLSG